MAAELDLQLKQLFSAHPLLKKILIGKVIISIACIFPWLEVIKINNYNTTTLSIIITTYIIFAPFIYFFLARHSSNQLQFEKRFNQNFEALVFGIMLPAGQFNPLITILFIIVVGGAIVIGGIKLVLTRAISSLIGIAIGILAFGFTVNIEITPSLVVYTGIGYAIFCFITGYFTYTTAIQISETRKLLKKEQEKSEGLLLNILPKSIAQRLKNQDSVIADSFENISVLFADLVGFTVLSVKLSPEG